MSKGIVTDFTLIYCQKDKLYAIEIFEKIKQCGLNGYLYGEINTNFHPQCKMFLASSNVEDDDEFVQLKNDAITNKELIIPIWLQSKKDISRSAWGKLYGVMAIQGLNPHSKYFEENVKKLIPIIKK